MDAQKQESVQPPDDYSTPQTSNNPYYLDSIAPPPKRSNFLGGQFNKIFAVLVVLLILAVGIIFASSSGKSNTAGLENIAVRLENLDGTNSKIKTSLKDRALRDINVDFQIWISDSTQKVEEQLKIAKIKKSKSITKTEKAYFDALNKKFDEARFAAILDEVYTTSMISETEKLINQLNTLSKKGSSKSVKEFAKEASTNLTKIKVKFENNEI